jgi:hypothetical protein
VSQIDAETLNARLLGGHRLLVTRGAGGQVISCEIEFFGDDVPVALFSSYLATGMIIVPKDGNGFVISPAGKRRLTSTRSRR